MSNNSDGVSALSLLGIVFVALKLTGHINWSWWWVTAPFWGGFALFGIILILALIKLSVDTSVNRRVLR